MYIFHLWFYTYQFLAINHNILTNYRKINTYVLVFFFYYRNFGLKVLNIKPILKKLQSILEVKDKSVRDEAKLLALELFSWIGPTSVKTYLANLKPLQV